MFDKYNRKITYLRISVTDKCNLRCTYCMPAEGIEHIPHSEILTFEEIVDFTRIAAKNGINKVRITGGEPLVRKGIVSLVNMLSKIEGITDLSMTTNGVLLANFAHDLKAAGLQRVNISLDTLDPEKYKTITRVGSINDVIKGIEAAKQVGFNPIKINCVVENDANEPDAKAVKQFALENGLVPRFIPKMDLEHGIFGVVDGGDGGNCAICNRIRLTANGMVKPCLFSNSGYSIRELGAEQAFKMAIENKPACGTINQTGQFYNIGG
ncbi:MAG TPA: radical SAM protein [Tenuifilaceae bacterium]|nr:radical SAM protein [Tenuifilaceae bacterium]